MASATYQLDGGEEIPFTYGQEITVDGEVLADGAVTVTLKGVDETGNQVGPFEATCTNSYQEYYLVLGVDLIESNRPERILSCLQREGAFPKP